jgi:chromosome segregation ATPase
MEQLPSHDGRRYTAPSNHLVRANEELIRGKDELTRMKDDLIDERDVLMKEKEGLTNEREGFVREEEELMRERDELTGDRDGLAERGRDLLGTLDAFRRERDDLMRRKNELIRERHDLMKEREDLSSEFSAQKATVAGITEELRVMKDELASAQRGAEEGKSRSVTLERTLRDLERRRTADRRHIEDWCQRLEGFYEEISDVRDLLQPRRGRQGGRSPSPRATASRASPYLARSSPASGVRAARQGNR